MRGTRERHGADDRERSGESREAQGTPFEWLRGTQFFAFTSTDRSVMKERVRGPFIDDLAFMILATPIFYPVVMKLGFDPVVLLPSDRYVPPEYACGEGMMDTSKPIASGAHISRYRRLVRLAWFSFWLSMVLKIFLKLKGVTINVCYP